MKCPTSRSNVCTAVGEVGGCHPGNSPHPAHLTAGRVQVDKALSHLSHPGVLQYVWVLSTHTVLGLFAPFYGPVLEAIARISTLILVRLRGALSSSACLPGHVQGLEPPPSLLTDHA